tara:strand:+ start:5077 stop:7476 length:2400 start_codon:yes stop_codon:yes gene_type:complete
MSSEILGGAENLLKGNLGGAWDIKHGYADAYTDLGIAGRFGGSAAAYSLRDIGAMNGSVVRVRREPHDTDATINDEENFSANQVSSGALEDWVNGKLETALPCNVGGTNFTSGSFVVSNSNNSNVNGTYTFNSSNSRWEKSSIIYFHLDSSTWTLVVSSSNIAATTNGEYPWTSVYSLVSSNISFDIQFSSILFSTASAAYSLRKVNNGYTGSAVRIRRGSDDIEVNVAFDSEDKVSASSSILNTTEVGGESGRTTDTTLGGFLNEVLTVGVAVEGGSSASDRPDSFTNATNSSFTATVTDAAGGYFPYLSDLNDVIVVSFDIVLTGGASPSLCTSDGVNTTQNRSNSITINSSGSYTKTLTCDQNTGTATHIRFADSDDGTFAVTNFRVVSHTHSAFVHTWYDQAGFLNNAVQETAANQPKIASSGTLLSSLDYSDGGKFLQLSSTVSVGEDVSLFGVVTKSTGTDILFDARTGAGAGFRVFEQSSVQKFNYDATTVSSSVNPSAGNNFLITAIQDGSNAKIGVNANTFDTAAETTVESVTPTPVIGGKSFTTVGADNWEGTISEIIYYTSDQTDNRFRIESNINNYYGLYTFQGDGFVETLYDQSGNGNDVSQTTAGSQPKIVDSGSQVKVDGIPSIKFDGTDDFLERATYTQGDLSQPNTAFAVAKLRVYVDDNQKIFDGHNNPGRNMIQLNTVGNGQFAAFAGVVQATGEDADADQHLFESRFNGSSSRFIIDGVIKNTNSPGTQSMVGINIGANHDSGTNFWDGDIQEIIIYNSDLFDDRADIENDINNYYTIY